MTEKPGGFSNLFALYVEMTRWGDISLDFGHVRAMTHNAAAFLGGAIFSRRSQGLSVTLERLPNDQRIRRALARSGFLASVFDYPNEELSPRSVPFHRFTNAEEIESHLEREWLGPGWIMLSEKLKSELVSTAYEIYWNAIEHSGAHEVFSCGYFYPVQKKLQLCIVDFGISIPESVRGFLRAEFASNEHDEAIARLRASSCLRWAFMKGYTTKPETSRGLGLDLLRDFVQVNKGRLDIFSQNGHARVSSNSESFVDRPIGFGGTAVNIVFNCDDNYYSFADERIEEPLF